MRYVILPILGLLYGYWTVCSIHDLFNLKDGTKWWIGEIARIYWVCLHAAVIVVYLIELIALFW